MKKKQRKLVDIFSRFKLSSSKDDELPEPTPDEIEDDFFQKVNTFCKSNNIQIENQKVIRKNTEIEMIIRVPSVIGKVEYYCYAKNKKKSTDGDLSTAYVKGQMKKLPALYITTGEITKKAMAMVEKEFKGMIVKII